jgi:cytochrome b involved in lipid metabolism
MAEVALHKDAKSCYAVIRGEVYNLTLWIAQHPGGDQAILSICGKDGTVAFVNQHGGRSRQEDALATFKIGVLAK